MNRILLVELTISADVREQKWNEDCVILFRDGTEDALKFRLIIRAEIWRHPHASNDDSNLRILRFRFVDDRLQICFQHVRRQSAQAVIRPERDDENVDLLLQQPIDSVQTVRVVSPLTPALMTSNGRFAA